MFSNGTKTATQARTTISSATGSRPTGFSAGSLVCLLSKKRFQWARRPRATMNSSLDSQKTTSFSWLIETGAVCALNFPIGMNPGLAKALGVMMKLDFQRAVLNRIPEIESHPEQYFRQVLFLCDEYQHFATVGESEPTGDEKFFSLSRQPKCIPIIATQSISSLKSALPGESWRTLLQTFRTKIFLSLSDDFSARTASELCGREDKLKVSYSLSESGHDTKVSWLTGKALSHKANIVASKSYNTQSDYRFDMKTFMELRNAQSIVLAYDGIDPKPPMFCYLKPYYNDPNESYFVQLAKGKL